ncbi:hypothetical protein HI914_01542 [Erysiphe necator]|nr:hypothetical protein HI914_01542 [Erysiphe necator]
MPDSSEIVKVLAELEHGEKTAQMLESKLTSLETKLDNILASCQQQTSALTDELNNTVQQAGRVEKEKNSGLKDLKEKK